MYTFMIGITSLGFFLNYLASKRIIQSPQTKLRTWALANATFSKGLGLAALITGLLLHVVHLGFGAGTFAFILTLMTAGSLIILLHPMNIIKKKVLTRVASVFLLLELFI